MQKPTIRPRGSGRLPADEASRVNERLLSAATELFFSQGYDRTTMESIAKTAGASSKTLYQRYPKKPDLLMAVMTHFLDQTIPPTPFPANPASARDVLRPLAQMLAAVSSTKEAAGLNRLIFSESHRFPDLFGVVMTLHERAIAAVEPTLAWLESLGLIRKFQDRRVAALLFLEMTASLPRIGAMLGQLPPQEYINQMLDEAVDLFLMGCQRENDKPSR